MKKIITFTFLLSQLLIAGESGFKLLELEVDARSAALLGGGVVWGSDASATALNPAKLAANKESNLVATYGDMPWDVAHSFGAYQFNYNQHHFALSFNYFKIPGIEIRGVQPTAEPIDKSEAFNFTLGVSYAREVMLDWNLGITVNYLFEKYYQYSAPGLALDLGLTKENLFKNIDFGLTVKNVGKMSKLNKKATNLPLMVRTGLAWKLSAVLGRPLVLMPVLQWVKEKDLLASIGVEYAVWENVYLRAGIGNGQEALRWSAGVGFEYSRLKLHYAYAPKEFDLGASNRITIVFKI